MSEQHNETSASIAIEALGKKNAEIRELRAQLAASERKLEAVTAALEELVSEDMQKDIVWVSRKYPNEPELNIFELVLPNLMCDIRAALEAARGDDSKVRGC
jgi:hypothetical protein